MINNILRALFYWPIRITANCTPIPFEPAKHIKIDHSKEIVYIMVSSSVANMLTLERLTTKLDWPSPFGTVRIGNQELPRTVYLRTPALFSSNAHEHDIAQNIFAWFDACQKAQQEVQIIPVSVLWSRDPSIEGSAIQGLDLATSSWRKFFTILLAGHDNCTIISDPINSNVLRERLEQISDINQRKQTLHRLLTLHFLHKVRSVVGRPFPNRAKLLHELVHRHGTQTAIHDAIQSTFKQIAAKAEQDLLSAQAAESHAATNQAAKSQAAKSQAEAKSEDYAQEKIASSSASQTSVQTEAHAKTQAKAHAETHTETQAKANAEGHPKAKAVASSANAAKASKNGNSALDDLPDIVFSPTANEKEKTDALQAYFEKKAYEIFDVMVADTRYPLLRFFNCAISKIWKRIYHGQSIIGANRVRELVQSGHEIIYIPCHRSHMDYILLLFAIFHEGLPIPQVASGDNLNFFPVGNIIRRCGSYFIRRKMKGDYFYTALFREYLSVLFERGYATEFFIEGGRSRTGRTLPPRSGMVSMAVQAQLRGIERPIVFIPTYLGYEHVMEVGSYMHELEGAKKKKESIKGLLGIFKRLRYYGRGYVTFGEPISIPRYLAKHVPDWHKDIDPSGNARPAWLYETVNLLSHEIILKLNDSATVNGINLCALALMGDVDHTLSLNMLKRCLKLYLIILSCDEKRQAMMATMDIDILIHQALELNKFHVYKVGPEMRFAQPSYGQIMQLTYFQNNILHLFALPALIANIIIRNGHISRRDVNTHTRSLFYFLRHELYAPDVEEMLDTLISRYINVFVQSGFLVEQDHHMLMLSGDGLEEFSILANNIRPNLVRYVVAVTVLQQVRPNDITREKFIAICVELCHHVPNEVTNNSPEFADPIMFNIMCDTFIRHKYFEIAEDKTIIPHPNKLAKLSSAAEPLLAAKLVRHLKKEVTLIRIYGLNDPQKAAAEVAAAVDAAEAAAAANDIGAAAAELSTDLAKAEQEQAQEQTLEHEPAVTAADITNAPDATATPDASLAPHVGSHTGSHASSHAVSDAVLDKAIAQAERSMQ